MLQPDWWWFQSFLKLPVWDLSKTFGNTRSFYMLRNYRSGQLWLRHQVQRAANECNWLQCHKLASLSDFSLNKQKKGHHVRTLWQKSRQCKRPRIWQACWHTLWGATESAEVRGGGRVIKRRGKKEKREDTGGRKDTAGLKRKQEDRKQVRGVCTLFWKETDRQNSCLLGGEGYGGGGRRHDT